MNKIKRLFFDVGSTLVDESLVYENRMRWMAQAAHRTYDDVYQSAMNYYKQNKKGDLEMLKQLNLQAPKWDCQNERLYADTEAVLSALSGPYKIGIIANQLPGTTERLEQFGIRKYIHLVIASAEEGVAKPDRRIFALALERSHCDPAEAVMIGDRIDNDIVPAKALGMKTIWVKQGFGQYWKITRDEEKADFVVDHLAAICEILKNDDRA